MFSTNRVELELDYINIVNGRISFSTILWSNAFIIRINIVLRNNSLIIQYFVM